MDAIKELSGGLSNKIYLIGDNVLLRIFGENSNTLVDSDYEAYVMRELGKLGISPKILLEFNGGRLEEFIKNSRSLTTDDLSDDKILGSLIEKIKQLHQTSLHIDTEICLIDNIHYWTEEAKRINPNFQHLYDLESVIISMVNGMQTVGICLCHNDLQKNNILVNKDTKEIKLIDFEYAGYNFIEFELANFLFELTVDYHPDGFEIHDVDLSVIHERVCHQYMPDKPDLINNLRVFTIAAHYIWAIWAIIKSPSNGSFNYIEYCNARFNLLKKMLNK